MNEPKIAYEPHPITPERKAELRAKGFTIVDAIYAPKGGAAGDDGPETIVPLKRDADGSLGVDNLSVGKGPGGRWYVKRGRTIVSGPFATGDEAEDAKAKEPT